MAESSGINTLINALTAFGTLSVAAIAIWGERIRSWLSPPKLSLRLYNPRGAPNLAAKGDQTLKVMYFHLKVVNAALAISEKL